MEPIIKKYLKKCLSVFDKHRSTLTTVVEISQYRSLLGQAIEEAEKSEEFNSVKNIILSDILSSKINELCLKEKRRLEKRKHKGTNIRKSFDKSAYRAKLASHATKRFFRNAGIYLKLWQREGVDIQKICDKLQQLKKTKVSELLRIYVFDGITLYENKSKIESISLPVGEIKKIKKGELEKLFRLPQSHYHDHIDKELAERVSQWQVLTVRHVEKYRGITGLWIDGKLIYPIGFDELGDEAKSENEAIIIGPLFLFIGTNINLAEEIIVRTNDFDSHPVNTITRNNFLDWKPGPPDGDLQPVKHVVNIGGNGESLNNFYKLYNLVNDLDKSEFLVFPTAAYIRSVLANNRFRKHDADVFVSLATVIESLLTPGTRVELAYKTAIRGASLLSQDSEKRIQLFRALDEIYKIRSQIVHEGFAEKEKVGNLLMNRLFPMTRQIFIRYIALIYTGLKSRLPKWALANPDYLRSNKKRLSTISRMLDSIVISPEITAILDDGMERYGIYENWWRHTDLKINS